MTERCADCLACEAPCQDEECIVIRAADALEELATDLVTSRKVVAGLKEERDVIFHFVPRSCKTCKKQDSRYLADGKLDDVCATCIRNRRCNWDWCGAEELLRRTGGVVSAR